MIDFETIDRNADLRAEYRDEEQSGFDEYDEWERLDAPSDRLSLSERKFEWPK